MLSHLNITDHDILEILEEPEEQVMGDVASVIRDDELDVPYNLSTMTICGRLGGTVNIERVISEVPIQPYWAIREGIIRTEGYIANETVSRGISRKYIEKRNIKTKPFRNSASLYCRIFDEELDIVKEPSIKIFRNGGFQVTGIRTPAQATHIVSFIKQTLRDLKDVFEEVDEGFTNVCMMNSDITMPYMLNRNALQAILKEKGILSTFETTSYQGINIKYYWNYEKHVKCSTQNGVCDCEHVCESTGKKRVMKNPSMKSNGGCVRITIAPFQTGKIIITGAKTIQQINDASKWILSLILENRKAVLQGKAPEKKIRRKIPFRGGYTLDI